MRQHLPLSLFQNDDEWSPETMVSGKVPSRLSFLPQLCYNPRQEREIEIGYPTDVKHVAHIGWDGPSGSGPSWMSEFKTAPDFSTSLGNLDDQRDPNPLSTTIMPPRDNADSSQSSSIKSKDPQSHQHPRVPKKQKRKKTKLGSSKSSLTSSASSKHLRAAKPTTTTYNEMETPPPVVQV